MSTVDHTHPDTGRPFGDAVVYRRGPTVAADGGESERSEHEPRRSAERSDGGTRPSADDHETDAETDEADGDRMKDVDHEPPNEADANRVFERGNEGRDETR